MEDSAKSAALFLAPEAPYPVAGGGSLRSACLLEYLASRYAVDLIVFREPGSPDPGRAIPRGLLRDSLVIELPYHSRSRLARLARNMSRVLRGVPPLNDRFAGFGQPIAGFLSGKRYRLAVIEHFWCAPYWEQLAPHSEAVILDMHNLESLVMARSAALEAWPVSYVFRRFHEASLALESQWLPRFDLVLAASAHDASEIHEIAPSVPLHTYPNSIPWQPEPAVPVDHAIAFSGNLEYHPNADAVRYFHARIWPLLSSRWPDLVWRLIGKNPEAVRRLLSRDPRIQIVGPVENAVRELGRAQVAVVPIRTGSGTRIKILEAWAAARPVVSTRIGAEGLTARDGEHLLIRDTPQQFAGAVSDLLESDGLRRQVGRAGRALYEKEYTWESSQANLRGAGI